MINTKKIDIDYINNSNINELINSSEDYFHTQLKNIAHDFVNKYTNKKFILLAGPSSSGKTTACNLMIEKLKFLDVNAKLISLDDFFIDRSKTPLLENGAKDYESTRSIDWALFNKCINELLDKKESVLPKYNFIDGKKHFLDKTTLNTNEIIIIEGLHALNPILDNYIPTALSIKCFINPEAQYLKEKKVQISSYNIRLIRRILRDISHRGYDPCNTLAYWPTVIEAEKKHVLPFMNEADYIIDSSHSYEPRVYKSLLKKIMDDFPVSISKALDILKDFEELEENLVPKNSVLQEFIG